MTATVFCLDFDETLMNTDRLRADLAQSLQDLGGEGLAKSYHEAYESTRRDHGVPRLPLVLKTLAEQTGMSAEARRELAALFHKYPYQNYIYPGVEQVIAQLKKYGQVLVLSDGDAFFQPQKIYSTTVASAVDAVVVSPGKISHFDDLVGYWPAERYVFIDDKQKVLDAVKEYFGEQATTVLVRQGRYADAGATSTADLSVATIAEVATLKF